MDQMHQRRTNNSGHSGRMSLLCCAAYVLDKFTHWQVKRLDPLFVGGEILPK